MEKIKINGVEVEISNSSIYVYTEQGLLSITPYYSGIQINSHSTETPLIINQFAKHLMSVEIIKN